MFDAIRIIYAEDGLAGFFKGLIPRVIADVVFISISATLVYAFTSYFGRKQPIESLTVMASNVSIFFTCELKLSNKVFQYSLSCVF